MRYGILGVAQATDEAGGSVPVGGPRLRTLLTALALRPGRTVTAETLIAEVWADDPPRDAPAALQALVGRLRRALGRHTVTSVPGGYRLESARGDIDLFVFERLVRDGTAALETGAPAAASRTLTEALALWRGPALADLPDRTAASRAEALRLEAVRARTEAALRLGRAHDVVPELRELTATHPYDESLHALLVRALRDAGRGGDALAAYETARRTLSAGLGTDPGRELRELHRTLLTQSPPAEVPARPVSAAAPAQPPERAGNIRPRLNSFVGREPELEAVRSELHRARLVTLTGPGGSGKTRLAEEAAVGLPQAWLVELAPLDQPEAVPGAVVSALGLRETVLMTNDLVTPQSDPVALLVEYCAPRSQLLILDNCEHVVGAVATLAETLLTRCPGLTILATSREPLGVPGESVRPVEPLTPEQACRLFAERATAVRSDAAAALRDEDAVTEICRRLDGLPLAVELAAARLRLLTPRQIADRLDDRFRLLTSGSRTALPRQQTLRAVVDWSWDLLDEAERTMLREVSVFAGGWDLTAAEAVCTGPAADLIGALVDKSLIVATPDGPQPLGHPHAPADPAGLTNRESTNARGTGTSGRSIGTGGTGTSTGGMRYRMLETIHEYAVERADEVPEQRAAAELRHCAWAHDLVERAEPMLRSAEQLPWIGRLESEHDNIRAALRRAVRDGREEDAGAIVVAIGWFWWLRNYRLEAAAWARLVLRLGVALDAVADGAPAGELPRLVERADPVGAFLAASDGQAPHPLHDLRTDLRMLYVFLVSESGTADFATDDRTPAYVTRVRDAFRHGGPRAARMPGLVWPLTAQFDPVGVRPTLDAALANCRAYGGDWEVGVVLMFRTHMVVDSPGNLRGVDDDLAELRILSRRVGDRWMRAQVCGAAGEAALARGRFEEARSEYEEALRLAHEVGAWAESPFLLTRLAEISYRSGDRDGALAALDEAGETAERYGVADARAFTLMLRAHIALDDGDAARARELCDAARAGAVRGTPPPQFICALGALGALITTAESGPGRGLPILVDALREAVAQRCAETVTAGLADIGAQLLAALGDLPGALRLLTASDHWRAGRPRPLPERARAERIEAAARENLPEDRCAAERTRGASLTVDDALDQLRAHPTTTERPAPSGN
ncbi:BTAD domain-containing putative transcriptional regulator [Streptomyces sp. NPDC006012]|uniref:BTAD domain-containing putative transcriptional regulator n=1 Tax=Streptomyces sp. NPDC006012 TaxID=3364739 RepID=UPI0036B9D203